MGRAEEDFGAVVLARTIGVFAWAMVCRRALRLVKYKAEPKPVRRAEGRVPRQSPRIGFGEERIVWRVGTRDCLDCWTRVLRRSAGWRRMEEVRPEQRPAVKWNAVLDASQGSASNSEVSVKGHTLRGARLHLRHCDRAII